MKQSQQKRITTLSWRNVQTPLEIGVTQDELFGMVSQGPHAILRHLRSARATDLKLQCKHCLDAANEFTRFAVFKNNGP